MPGLYHRPRERLLGDLLARGGLEGADRRPAVARVVGGPGRARDRARRVGRRGRLPPRPALAQPAAAPAAPRPARHAAAASAGAYPAATRPDARAPALASAAAAA